ncbi:MAG: ImmA/IrrE family metallo-endopeptidase [Thermoanaerobaculia bacterium]
MARPGVAGALEPLGNSFADGFRILIDPSASENRRRFTLAHEICHTFFYELVPEIKFRPHDVFPDEERLCDVGASELLMPARSLKKSAKDRPVSVETLQALADEYSVSKSAMLLRLRALDCWKCELTEWHRMRDGSFSLLRVIGGVTRPWLWEDDSILPSAWEGGVRVGTAYVSYRDERGIQFYRPEVRFQVVKFSDKLVSLWGPDVCAERDSSRRRSLPLFGE